MISRDQALNIVKKHSNFSNKAIIETELDDGKYEITIKEPGKELEYEVDAYTGKILQFSKEDVYKYSYFHKSSNKKTDKNKSVLSIDQVKKIALSKEAATEMIFTKFKTDTDDGTFVYEISIIYKGGIRFRYQSTNWRNYRMEEETIRK